MEHEAKAALTEAEYETLLEYFQKKTLDAIEQVNSYYDTEDLVLNDTEDMTLRSRIKKEMRELTLKGEGIGNGRLETNHRPFTDSEKERLDQEGHVPAGVVRLALELAHLAEHAYLYHGDLTTFRIEFPYEGCKLALDYSEYLGICDYEIEMERAAEGVDETQVLKELLAGMRIPHVAILGKRKRFFLRKQQIGAEVW